MSAEDATTRLLAFVDAKHALVGISRDAVGDWGVSLRWGRGYKRTAIGLGASYEAAINDALSKVGTR